MLKSKSTINKKYFIEKIIKLDRVNQDLFIFESITYKLFFVYIWFFFIFECGVVLVLFYINNSFNIMNKN